MRPHCRLYRPYTFPLVLAVSPVFSFRPVCCSQILEAKKERFWPVPVMQRLAQDMRKLAFQSADVKDVEVRTKREQLPPMTPDNDVHFRKLPSPPPAFNCPGPSFPCCFVSACPFQQDAMGEVQRCYVACSSDRHREGDTNPTPAYSKKWALLFLMNEMYSIMFKLHNFTCTCRTGCRCISHGLCHGTCPRLTPHAHTRSRAPMRSRHLRVARFDGVDSWRAVFSGARAVHFPELP